MKKFDWFLCAAGRSDGEKTRNVGATICKVCEFKDGIVGRIIDNPCDS